MHEHLFTLTTEVELNYPGGWDEEECVADAVRQLRRLKERGVDSLVDLTVLGLGRCISRIQRIAEQVDVNIVVATGLYTTNELPLQFTFQDPATSYEGREVLVEMFTADIEHGIADTGVRAGRLKCATDELGLTPGVERVLRAVARTHRATGVPISTHTHARTRRGLEQQRVFLEQGVDLARVVIGHCGDTDELPYLRELMEAGSTIGMDRFGINVILGFEQRVATVAALCAEGYAGQLLGYGALPSVFQKPLAHYPCGDPKAQLLFFPPGLDPGRSPDEHPSYPPVLRAARHTHHRMIELLYVLDGDMPLSEWESVEQQQGERAWWREGFFLYRRPGSIHGAEPGETSVAGVTILHFRLGGSADPGGPAFPEEIEVDIPFVR